MESLNVAALLHIMTILLSVYVASSTRMNRVHAQLFARFFFYLEIILNRKSVAVTHALHFISFCISFHTHVGFEL